MKRSIAIFTISAIASMAAIHAGEKSATAAKQKDTASVQKASATDACCADTSSTRTVAAKPAQAACAAAEKVAAKTACCAEEASTTASRNATKRLKRAQATAKGGYRG